MTLTLYDSALTAVSCRSAQPRCNALACSRTPGRHIVLWLVGVDWSLVIGFSWLVMRFMRSAMNDMVVDDCLSVIDDSSSCLSVFGYQSWLIYNGCWMYDHSRIDLRGPLIYTRFYCTIISGLKRVWQLLVAYDWLQSSVMIQIR